MIKCFERSTVERIEENSNDLSHSCPILSNRFYPTKQHSICCRSENCISLARSGQSAVDSIDSFDLSNGKVYYRFDKCGRRSDNRELKHRRRNPRTTTTGSLISRFVCTTHVRVCE